VVAEHDANDYYIYAKTEGYTGINGGNGSRIRFKILYLDDNYPDPSNYLYTPGPLTQDSLIYGELTIEVKSHLANVILNIPSPNIFVVKPFNVISSIITNTPPVFSGPINPPAASYNNQFFTITSSTYSNVFNISSYFSDSDLDSISYAATGLPPGLSVNVNGFIIGRISPTLGSYSYAPIITVSDGTTTVTGSFTWNITQKQPIKNYSPSFSTPVATSVTVDLNDYYEDILGDTLYYSLVGLPTGLVINNGIISGSTNNIGTYTINIVVYDNIGGVLNDTFNITVV
jgi:hypothetical protein